MEKIRLESRAASEGIPSLRFIDPVPKSEIYGLLDEADIFVLPLSKGELFRHGVSPNKLFDYMATGRPIVYAVDSSNDPVTECDAGIRVAPEDPSAMADALKELQALTAEERFDMGMRGRQYASANHELRGLAVRLERVLVSSVADKRRPSRSSRKRNEEMTSSLVVSSGMALLVTVVTEPVVVRWLRWRALVDVPNDRSSHLHPTLRGGGIAIVFGFSVGSLAGAPGTWTLVLAVVALALIGLLDDVRPRPAISRLVAQVLLGAAAGAAAAMVAGDSAAAPEAAAIGLVLVPASVNAVNFMDGIDGLTALNGLVIATLYAVAAVRLDAGEVAVAAVAMGAACAGFLPWSFSPRSSLPRRRWGLRDRRCLRCLCDRSLGCRRWVACGPRTPSPLLYRHWKHDDPPSCEA